jgi:hypothetical protein
MNDHTYTDEDDENDNDFARGHSMLLHNDLSNLPGHCGTLKRTRLIRVSLLLLGSRFFARMTGNPPMNKQ